MSHIAIVGGGYVGLPMALVVERAGYNVVVLDIDEDKVEKINSGVSYISDISSEELKRAVTSGRLSATTNPAEACGNADAILVCVPTPLQTTNDPDLSFVITALESIIPVMGNGVLLALESTVYPGFTREVVGSILLEAGLIAGETVYLSFSPERVDPGNGKWTTSNTPKVVGGLTSNCLSVAKEFYESIVENVVPVSSTDVAETVKLLENTFRSINIALVNELAMQCHELGLDVWEVIGAAATKPFGFMPFYPGPGVGGHCIGPDPQYLAWKLRTLQSDARFVRLASQVNSAMPSYVVERVTTELNRMQRCLNGSKILLVGLAYKPNVSDTRESPSLKVAKILFARGADVTCFDPHITAIPFELLEFAKKESEWSDNELSFTASLPSNSELMSFDAALILTAHSGIDYERLVTYSQLVFDTRNATRELRCERRAISL